MLEPIRPLFEKEDGSGQGGGGQNENGQPADGQENQEEIGELVTKINDLATNFDNQHKTVEKWASEMGEVRQVGDSIGLLGDRLSAIEERLSSTHDDDEIDLLDSKQLSEYVTGSSSKASQEAVKPILEKLQKLEESVMTKDGLTEMLGNAQRISLVKQEFKLTDEEGEELNQEASEKGTDIKLLAYEKYAERKFGDKKFSSQLTNELKNKDGEPPPSSASEAIYEKLGIPTDDSEFERLYKEKGSSETKRLLMEADKMDRGDG